MIVGLEIKDPAMYENYREAMKPILKKYGGGFRYDFWIKETLKSDTKEPINRVFAIYFEDKNAKDNFYSDLAYKAVKEKFFAPSVGARTILAEYSR
jgi:uncharacterized protein (DUF1330 family)